MKQELTRGWRFYRHGDPAGAVTVDLPHDAMITEPRSKCLNGANTGYFPGGRYVYERDLEIEEADIGKCISLIFEGVYRNATVSLNGEALAFHAYGYTEFEVDLSEKVHAGTNKLLVDVDNSLEPNSRWYSGSGIYRPVWLSVKPKEHLSKIRIETKSVDPAVITVSGDAPEGTKVCVYDGDTLVAEGTLGDITVPDARLWDAEHPFLYRIRVECPGDAEEFLFGIRKLSWSAETGVCVNGQEVKFRGACIHHDNGILGACEFDAAAERRIRILKEAGYNSIRSAHNPCSRAILRACDKLGMYVMDESFDMWYIPKTYHDYSRDFAENHETDILSMVERDYNHACVVMYSVGNENGELGDARGIELLQQQAALIRAADPTRIVTIGANLMLMGRKLYKEDSDYKREPQDPSQSKDMMANLDKQGSTGFNMVMNMLPKLMLNASKGKKSAANTDKLVPYVDVLGLNYGTPRYEPDIARDPGRLYCGSETMSHAIVDNWEIVKKHHQIIGDFVWTGWDYLGEAGTCGAWDYVDWGGLGLFDGAGTVDATGYLTAADYYMQIEYGTYQKPYIAVKPVSYTGKKYYKGAWRMTNAIHSWSWNGFEGTKAEVEVYGIGKAAELFINGKSVGKKPLRKNRAIFKTVYQPGEISTKVYASDGSVWGEDKLRTAGEATVLSVSADKSVLCADGQDLCYIDIELTDKNGELKPAADKTVSVCIEGAGVTLAGLGSARTKTAEVFDKPSHLTHFGRAQAILRSGLTPGKATVTVSCDGMEAASLEVTVRPE
jgi:hypothetical protein